MQDRLEGKVHGADGREITGPRQAPFKGRNKPHRGDRKWVNGWSPEQIANRLRIDFPDDESMRISHEAIYQALYIQGRGALKRELVSCLRTGPALRVPRARAQAKAWAHVSEGVMISSRPAEVEDRAVPGHWEGDLIIGLNRSAIGTLVERSTRFTMLVHLPREEGYGLIPRTKNGPALAGYGAVTMTNALKKTVTGLPMQLWQSLTWDRGKELSDHARFTIESGVKVFFADPHSPWQRGTNENTNGLLRQYFPKGTDLSRWSAQEIQAVAHALNTRPRKTLGWKTPAETLNEYLKSIQQSRVLRRPVESAQYVSIRYSERLAEAGVEPSVGSVGDSYDNALAETINGLYKAEVIHRRSWQSREAVELATLEWVDWFNHRRLLEPIGNMPPAEAEANSYQQLTESAQAA
ncbi:IS30 family transposase [Pseudomonas sp. SST3]|uniref:IS30 family transposase n=1 Tax=Pseudomonas sp. SST3 TaxID=2267882 RepID=UPI00406C2A69